MKRLPFFLLFASALFAQSGGQTVWIPIQTPPELGYGSSFSQDLGVTPQSIQKTPTGYTDGVYVIHFQEQNHFPPYPGKWELELTFGTQKLCDWYGWGTRHSSVIETCTSSAYLVIDQALPGGGPVQGGNNLVATWTVNDGSFNGGWPIIFKDAWLTFTPTD